MSDMWRQRREQEYSRKLEQEHGFPVVSTKIGAWNVRFPIRDWVLSKGHVVLSGASPITPMRWQHHLLIYYDPFYITGTVLAVSVSLCDPRKRCVCMHTRIHTDTRLSLTHTLHCLIQQALGRCHYNGHFRRGTWGLQRSYKFHMVKLYSKWWSLKSSQLQTSDFRLCTVLFLPAQRTSKCTYQRSYCDSLPRSSRLLSATELRFISNFPEAWIHLGLWCPDVEAQTSLCSFMGSGYTIIIPQRGSVIWVMGSV